MAVMLGQQHDALASLVAKKLQPVTGDYRVGVGGIVSVDMTADIAVHIKVFRDRISITCRNPQNKFISAIHHDVRSTGRRFGTIPVIALGIFKSRNHKFSFRKRRIDVVRDARLRHNFSKFL